MDIKSIQLEGVTRTTNNLKNYEDYNKTKISGQNRLSHVTTKPAFTKNDSKYCVIQSLVYSALRMGENAVEIMIFWCLWEKWLDSNFIPRISKNIPNRKIDLLIWKSITNYAYTQILSVGLLCVGVEKLKNVVEKYKKSSWAHFLKIQKNSKIFI